MRIAAWLAGKCKLPGGLRPADAYTFALFRDCGIPVLLIPFPEYGKVLQAANAATDACFTDLEEQQLGINHAVVGAELAEGWLLPPEICAAIRHHHSLEHLVDESGNSLPAASRSLIALAQTAEHLLQIATGLSQTSEWQKLGAACLDVLALDKDSFAGLLDALRQDDPVATE